MDGHDLNKPGAPTGRRTPLWPLLLIGGVALAVVMSRRNWTIRALLNRLSRGRAQLQSFRDAILGVDKRTVAAALGAPPASAGRDEFLQSDTWYYPLDPAQQTALAIRFDEQDVARTTQVLRTPRHEQNKL